MDIDINVYDEIATAEYLRELVGSNILYVDILNGDNDNGWGSPENPYQSVYKASEILTGGDEVRVAKSPDNEELTGTVSFAQDSANIVGTDTEFTTELALEEFILAPDGRYYRIMEITDDENIGFHTWYKGASVSDRTIHKVGVIPVSGDQSTSGTGGISCTNRLKISGGWDLDTEEQDGETNLFDPLTSQTGIVIESWFVLIEHFNFLGLSYGISSNANNGVIKDCLAVHCSRGIEFGDVQGFFIDEFEAYFCGNGIVIADSIAITMGEIICEWNTEVGIKLLSDQTDTGQIHIKKARVNHNGDYGLFTEDMKELTIGELEACYNNSDGVYIVSPHAIEIGKLKVNGNLSSGFAHTCGYGFSAMLHFGEIEANDNSGYPLTFYIDGNFYEPTFIEQFIASGNGSGDDVSFDPDARQQWWRLDVPFLAISRYQNTGLARNYFYDNYDGQDLGYTYGDVANSKSGVGKCLKFEPMGGAKWLTHRFGFKAEFDVDKTVKFWLKKTAEFNGEVQGALFFNYQQVTDWQTFNPTVPNRYEQKWLSVSNSLITCNGKLELKIRVNGDAGYVYLDDITINAEVSGVPITHSVLDQSSELEDSADTLPDDESSIAQTFIPQIEGLLDKIEMKLCWLGGSGIVKFEIFEWVDDAPVGDAIATQEINDTELASSLEWFTVNFDNPAVLALSTQYAIVVTPIGSQIQIAYMYEGAYDYGQAYYWTGSYWEVGDRLQDLMFRTYMLV